MWFLKIGLILTLFSLTISKPVDCANGVQTVLEVQSKIDCSDRSVCASSCDDLFPDCPQKYSIFDESDGFGLVKEFDPIYFGLENQIKTKFTKDAFQKACLDKRYETISPRFKHMLQNNAKIYLELLNKTQNQIIEATKIFSWALQFYSGLSSKMAKRQIDVHIPALKYIIGNFTKEEKDVYYIVRDGIFDQWMDRVKLYDTPSNHFSNPIMLLFRGQLRTIGKYLKTSYFGSSIYDIVDRWIENVKHFKKECRLKHKAPSNQLLIHYDENKMKNEKGYPFGPQSTFDYKKDRNSPELKALWTTRNFWFRRMRVAQSAIAYCKCLHFNIYFHEKLSELQSKNQDTSELIRERDKYNELMKRGCKIECNRRKNELKKVEILNNKARKRYNDRMENEDS